MLATFDDPNEALAHETYHQVEWKSDNLYNLTATFPYCDIAGIPKSIDHRMKIAAATKKRFADPLERQKLAIAMKGREFSAEHKAKLRSSALGRKASIETKAKQSAAAKAVWAQRKTK